MRKLKFPDNQPIVLENDMGLKITVGENILKYNLSNKKKNRLNNEIKGISINRDNRSDFTQFVRNNPGPGQYFKSMLD